jgi:two-component system heavy metal sensor histidine kinase CusS
MKFGSIRGRLLAWYLVVLSLGMLLFGSIVWFSLRYALVQSVDETLVEQRDGFVNFVQKEAQGTELNAILEETREYSSGLPAEQSLIVRTREGRLLFAAPTGARSAPDGFRTRTDEVTLRGIPLSVETGTSMEDVNTTLSLLRTMLVACFPVVLIVGAVGGWWISTQALRPVDNLTDAVEVISLRSLSRRLSVPATGDELQRLAEAWNRMLDRIDASVRQMTQFTADAAHELRTPVAIIRSTAELALRRNRDEASYRAALAEVHEETVYLTKLVEDLMWLARTDAGDVKLNLEPVSANDLVVDACRAILPIAEKRGIVPHVRPLEHGDAIITCDPFAIRRLLLILLDNAVKFTPMNGSVQIAVLAQPGRCRIEVRDTGEGVRDEDRARIFDRFYQADKSRTNSGLGLGLSIAKTIVEAHHGEIGVAANNDPGSCFYVELPAEAVTAAEAGVPVRARTVG